MGAELVKAASVLFAHLPGNQFKVLIRMCVTALDKPKGDKVERMYYGGWQPLALALGRDPVSATGPRRRKLKREVSDVCRELERAGAVKPLVEHPQYDTRQEYFLSLEPAGVVPEIGVPVVPENRVPRGTRKPGQGGTRNPGTQGVSTKEQVEDSPQEPAGPVGDQPQDRARSEFQEARARMRGTA